MYVPTKVKRARRVMGDSLRTQRKLLGLTAEMVAERADVSLTTLRHVEVGQQVRSDALLSILNVLGMLDAVVEAVDPYRTDIGRLRATEALPQRVRPR